MKNKGLGKGLRALIPQVEEEYSGEEILELPLSHIKPSSNQARRDFDEESLRELAVSISNHGLIQPVVVRPLTEDSYELIVGERRWRASQIAGIKTIPAVVKKVDQQTSAEMMLVENLQRKDLNPLEEARAYEILLTEFALTHEEIARRVGKSRSYVSNTLRLKNLPEDIQQLLADGILSTGHGKVLLGITDSLNQVILARQAVEKGLSVRELEKKATELFLGQDEEKTQKEKAMKQHFKESKCFTGSGWRMRVKTGKRGGRIEISCHSHAHLEKVLTYLESLLEDQSCSDPSGKGNL